MKRILKFILTSFFTALVRKQCKSNGDGLKVNGYSRVSNTTVLGNNIHFNGMMISGIGLVNIGDNFHSGKGCLMISQTHNYDKGSMIPYDDTYILKDILIEDNVWLGDRVIVLGGVTIGEGAIIQAGSVVVRDIPKYSIAGGHPAKVFSQRDIDHYNDLKFKESFN
tara:strand:- start:8 stop:505 length:498 start_codon:yes stop_codon:yes gene_type:complete